MKKHLSLFLLTLFCLTFVPTGSALAGSGFSKATNSDEGDSNAPSSETSTPSFSFATSASTRQNEAQWNVSVKRQMERREAQQREIERREDQWRKNAIEATREEKRQKAEEIVLRKIDSGWKPASEGFRDNAKADPTFSIALADRKNRVFGRIADCEIETPSNRIDFPEKSRLVVKYFDGMFLVKIGSRKHSTVDGNKIEATEEFAGEVKQRRFLIDNLWDIRITHYRGKKSLDYGVLWIRSSEPRGEAWDFVANLNCSPQSFK